TCIIGPIVLYCVSSLRVTDTIAMTLTTILAFALAMFLFSATARIVRRIGGAALAAVGVTVALDR
ncbi:MAG: hypothetical protein QF512_09465, partial [Alphaproteobacteria bacterium]|nr:hypothetical protein [Alphaproteobacteria bacterium]